MLAILYPIIAFGQERDTLKVDAVELINGREVQGQTKYSVARDNYVYLFAQEKNKKLFEKSPEQFEIQLGGACARMGILSGKGDTDLYTVHEKRLFIFASTSCKNTFLKDPSRVLEQDDARPETTPESLSQGQALLQKVVQAIGGEEKLNSLHSYQERIVTVNEYEGRNVEISKIHTFVIPNKLRVDDTWDTYAWASVVSEMDAFKLSSNGYRAMVPIQVHALRRQFLRNLIFLLSNRKMEGFIAVASGAERVAGRELEMLTLYIDGASGTLGIDAKSGRILSIRYKDFGPGMFLGTVEKHFSDYQIVGGLVLPMTITGTFDGQIVPKWSFTIDGLEINPVIEDKFFSRTN
jgi:YHS domain-containing protein